MKKLKRKGIYGTLKKIGWTSLFEVVEPFYWLLDYKDKSGWCIVAETWLHTNFGSIPRIMWLIFDPTKYNSYIIHDSGYARPLKYHMEYDLFAEISREEIDNALLEWLTYEGAGFIEKYCIYYAVRLFGWVAFYS